MSYTLTLTPEERETLAWLADRGYDCGLFDALGPTARDHQNYVRRYGPDRDSTETYTIPEHKAWEVYEAQEETAEAAWACLAWDSTLGVKISTFLESIV